MSLRFQRRIKLGPLRLNLSRRGVGISTGIPGLRVGVDATGRPYGSAGLPGTGLSVRKYGHRPKGAAVAPAGAGGVGVVLLVIVVVLVIGSMFR